MHTLDIKQLLDRAEFKDLWHLWHSDRNRALIGPFFAREIQVLLLEATTARYYCSLKRLAEKFPFDPSDYFIIGEHTEMVSQIHAGQMEGLSTAREINRTAAKPEAISREAANHSLNELDAIEDFYLSRMPANIAVPPLPAELVRSAEEAQPARKPVERQSAGGNPEPGPDEVDTTVCREIDVQFAVNTLGDLPDLGSLPLFEVPPEKWPKVNSLHLRLPELRRFSHPWRQQAGGEVLGDGCRGLDRGRSCSRLPQVRVGRDLDTGRGDRRRQIRPEATIRSPRPGYRP